MYFVQYAYFVFWTIFDRAERWLQSTLATSRCLQINFRFPRTLRSPRKRQVACGSNFKGVRAMNLSDLYALFNCVRARRSAGGASLHEKRTLFESTFIFEEIRIFDRNHPIKENARVRIHVFLRLYTRRGTKNFEKKCRVISYKSRHSFRFADCVRFQQQFLVVIIKFRR